MEQPLHDLDRRAAAKAADGRPLRTSSRIQVVAPKSARHDQPHMLLRSAKENAIRLHAAQLTMERATRARTASASNALALEFNLLGYD